MSETICKKTMQRCTTPGMCAPYGGCTPQAVIQGYTQEQYDTLTTRLADSERRVAESEHENAKLEARIGEQKPIGYIDKKDLARLTDEITWDGTHLIVGVDHFAQWLEDTPYEHLTPIYSAPPVAPEFNEALDLLNLVLQKEWPSGISIGEHRKIQEFVDSLSLTRGDD